MNHWPAEQDRSSQSAEAPAILIHDNSQAREWVKAALAGIPPKPGTPLNQELPSNTVAALILSDWGITAVAQ
eukprot:9028831-Heterocapsa_arctica.AAC.1